MINPYFRNRTIRPSFYSDYFRFPPRNLNLGRTRGDTLTSLGRQLKEYKERTIKPVNRFKPLDKTFKKTRIKLRI